MRTVKQKKLRRLLKFNLDSSPIYTQSAQSVPAALRIDGNAQDVWVSESSLIPQWQTKEPGPCYPAAVLGFASLITTFRAGDLNQKIGRLRKFRLDFSHIQVRPQFRT